MPNTNSYRQSNGSYSRGVWLQTWASIAALSCQRVKTFSCSGFALIWATVARSSANVNVAAATVIVALATTAAISISGFDQRVNESELSCDY